MGRRELILLWTALALVGAGSALLVAGAIAFRLHHIALGLRLGAAGLLFLVPGIVLLKIQERTMRALTRAFSNSLDRLDYVPANEADYPWLDRERLQQWTRDLAEEGFAGLGDYKLSTDNKRVGRFRTRESFARLMANDRRKCFAEISQSSHPETGVRKMTCAVVTLFTSGKQCRTWGAEPAEEALSGASDMLQHAGVTLYYQPGASPEELVLHHIEQRDRLATEQGLSVLSDLSFAAYQHELEREKAAIRDWTNRRVADLTGGKVPDL